MCEGVVRTFKIQFLLLFLFIGTMYGQEFSLLRQNDDLTALDSIKNKNAYQRLKAISLLKNTTLSFGGSWRFQAESFLNSEFNRQGSQDNIWHLHRFLGHAHLKTATGFELFAELGASVLGGKDDPSPVDRNELYLNQLFAKYRFTPSLELVAGRRNMRLGSGRLVDIREGPNVRRSFDMLALNYETSIFKANVFFSVPVQPRPWVLDDDYLKFNETFSGIYTTTQFSEKTNFDVYLFYKKDDNTTYNIWTENDRRATLGIRHFGIFNKFTYNNEAVYQFGKFGDQDISAWTLSIQVERETNILGRDFGIGIKTEAISGDRDASDQRLNTFDALYPRGGYFGRVARFGPSNLMDIHPYVTTTVNKWQFEIDYNAFWRFSTEDGVYGAPMTLDYPDTNDKRFIAHQVGTNLTFEPSSFINLQLESYIIFPGDFLIESGKPDTLYHFVLTTELRF